MVKAGNVRVRRLPTVPDGRLMVTDEAEGAVSSDGAYTVVVTAGMLAPLALRVATRTL